MQINIAQNTAFFIPLTPQILEASESKLNTRVAIIYTIITNSHYATNFVLHIKSSVYVKCL